MKVIGMTISKYINIIIIISLCLFSYLLYRNISQSTKVSFNQADQMMIRTSLNDHKAHNNDLSLQLTTLTKKSSSITKNNKDLQSSIANIAAEVTIISDTLKQKQSSIQQYQSRIKDMQYMSADQASLIKEHSEVLALQLSIKEMQMAINLLNNEHREGRLSNNEVLTIKSKIITTNRQVNLIKSWFQYKEYYDMVLLFRQSDHIDLNPKLFHERCDGYPYTLTVIQLENGEIIGGYTNAIWKGKGHKEDKGAFIFNLTQEKKYNVNDPSRAIIASGNLPCFGEKDLILFPTIVVSVFPDAYGDSSNDNCELTQGSRISKTIDFEVFQIVIN